MPYPYPGLSPSVYTKPYGGIPTVPSPVSTQGEAIVGDIGQLGNLYNLSRGVSQAAAGGARTQYEQNLPLYSPLTERGSANIMGNLRGEVSPDVINLLSRQAAERGVGFGPNSPNANAAFLSALGQTSMGRQDLGQQQLTQAIGRTPVGPMFNPASMLINPQQVQDAAMFASTLAAAPDPAAAAAAGRNAVNQGIGAGMGAGGGGVPSYGPGGGGRSTTPLGYGPGGPPQVVGASTGTGVTYGGVPYYGGSSPGSAGQSWQQWASGLPGSMTPSDRADESFWNDFMAGSNIGPIQDPGFAPPLGTESDQDASFWDDFWAGTDVGSDMFSDMGSDLELALGGEG